MRADVASIVSAVIESTALPETVREMDAGTRRLLEWNAARVGVTPQEYLRDAHQERAAATARDQLVQEILGAIRR